MEILQAIWNSLTIPNERLIEILSYFLVFIEVTLSMFLFITILNIESSKKQKFLFVIGSSIFSILSRLFIPYPYDTLLNILVMGTLIKFLFNTNLLRTIIAIIIPYFILILYEALFSQLYLSMFHITIDTLAIIPIYRLSFALMGNFCILVVFLLSKYTKFNITIFTNMNRKSKYILLTNFSVGIIILVSQGILTTYYSEHLPSSFIIIHLLSIFIYFMISIYSVFKTTQLQKANEDIENLQLYNKTLDILLDNIRAFKHDFNNIVQAFGGYIGTEDMAGLKKYYTDLMGDCNCVNNLTSLNPNVINNPSIFNILASKYHKAEEKGITINLEVFIDLNKLNMKTYEFTRVLGILLDNSIEASQECEEKIINVVIRPDFNIKRQLLIVENTYMDKNIDTEKIFEKSYTTKKNNTGLGLWEVRQILKKNSNLNLYTAKDEKYFKQQLEIYSN